MRRHFAKTLVAATTALAVGFGLNAAPAEAAPTGKLVSKRWIGNQLMEVKVYSPSMKRTITNQVMTPPNMGRAPVFYLLSGMYGGNGDQWSHPASGARKFFRNKNVYVVNPLGAPSTYYTDWYREDRTLGYKPMWETYLTQELPPAIARAFKTTGRNAIAGYSMSAGTALVQAGAGVVAASSPAAEAAETVHKARAVLEAVAAAQGAALVIDQTGSQTEKEA